MSVPAEKLRKLVPLAKLNEEALNQLANRGELLELARDARIFERGSKDDFIYYLLQGQVRMTDRDGKEAHLSAESGQARFAFGSLRPRPSDARVDSTLARLIRFDGRELNTLLAWHEQLSRQEDSEPGLSDISSSLLVSELEMDEKELVNNDWMMALLRCSTFYNVPPENVQRLAERMEPLSLRAGETVVRQNDPGDYYYVIREGRCRVQCNGVEVGTLDPLDAFGEEALLSGSPRNATVEMLTDGLLMRLSRENFNAILIQPLVKRVSLAEAKALALHGAILIDVRTRQEFKEQRLVRSINIPLFVLRDKLKKLNPDKTYIVYCDTGTRSSAATFLLNQAGYDAFLLDDPQAAFKAMAAKA
ncbi:MAG: cyclic nucleotide-binding domain-containing protein [Gammaproteobacteria bacterium]|nr:cyclic nucleotide-binding domain-containing protein [Gammaproteobacteria bacterium]MBU1654136.1 cyclic nucleotide-binding domain-containing protein [Gammaproteobacteria bacterium]MBU1960152.1 cyclic nucleotide-binding domain-containing protein [Gammaproteobacteria bacterium]